METTVHGPRAIDQLEQRQIVQGADLGDGPVVAQGVAPGTIEFCNDIGSFELHPIERFGLAGATAVHRHDQSCVRSSTKT
jgi:hypothetical protein